MNTEHDLTGYVRSEFRDRIRAGAPLWAVKVHGSQFQHRGTPDWLGCADSKFFSLETKRPGATVLIPSPAQQVQINGILRAHGRNLVANDLDDIRRFLDEMLG